MQVNPQLHLCKKTSYFMGHMPNKNNFLHGNLIRLMAYEDLIAPGKAGKLIFTLLRSTDFNFTDCFF